MFNIAPIARVNNSVIDKIINLRLIISLSSTPKASNHQARMNKLLQAKKIPNLPKYRH